MACEKLWILITKCMKIYIYGLNFFSWASDLDISRIISFGVSIIRNKWMTGVSDDCLCRVHCWALSLTYFCVSKAAICALMTSVKMDEATFLNKDAIFETDVTHQIKS